MSAAVSAAVMARRTATKPVLYYVVEWFDPARVEAAARKQGWTPESGASLMDACHPEEMHPSPRSTRRFPTVDAARAFGDAVVRNGGDFFGQARLYEMRDIPRSERCRACVCSGFQIMREAYIDGDAAPLDWSSHDSECLS